MSSFQGFGQGKKRFSSKDREKIFWSKVERKTSNECWNWKESYNKNTNQGRFWNGKRLVLSYRFAYESYYKCKIPINKKILHKCDNSLCCNPKHLYIGTQRDNMNDMRDRNRAISNNAKLYAGEIWLIRKLKKIKVEDIGKYTGRQNFIAALFKVSQATISEIWSSNKFTCKEGYYI